MTTYCSVQSYVNMDLSVTSPAYGDALDLVLFVGCLTSQQHIVYLRDGSAQTILRDATLR